MKKSTTWRFVVIALVLVAWIYSMYPLTDRDFMKTFNEYADQSNSNFPELMAEKQAIQDNRNALKMSDPRALKDAADKLGLTLNTFVTVPNFEKASNDVLIDAIKNECRGKLQLGLDLSGGTEFIIRPDDAQLDEYLASNDDVTKDMVLDRIETILRNRIDSSGVKEPIITRVEGGVSLKLPGVSEQDKDEVRSLLKQNAKLEFRMVHDNNRALMNQLAMDPKGFKAPAGYEVLTEKNVDSATGVTSYNKYLVKIRSELVTGEMIENAYPTVGEFGEWQVGLKFDSEGAKYFAQTTGENVNKQMAIVLDGTVYSAPNINQKIEGGSAVITGNFSLTEAQRLATVIASGSMPVSLVIDSEFGTDPSLGAESVNAGIIACVVGLLLVVVFMVGYYRMAGVIAVIALIANIVLVIGTMTILGASLTLPGIAGMVLTIGMAVDANVIIFERIREELDRGRSIANAIHQGYDRAFLTIFDANITTLLTAFILYKVGTGAVRGFSVTLGVGIVASMFTALFMTRTLFDFLLNRKDGAFKKMAMVRWLSDAKFDLMGKTGLMKKISIAAVVLAFVVMGVRNTDALSVDFLSGARLEYSHVEGADISMKTLEDALSKAGFPRARVGYKTGQGGKIIEVTIPELTSDQTDRIEAMEKALTDAYPKADLKQKGITSVGSIAGDRFKWSALAAIVLSMVGIVIYLSFRFEVKFALAANLALLHDVIICTGIFLLFGRELSLTAVAAVLTIIGYSLNDTIVVFDRIREDLTSGEYDKLGYSEVINLSLNQTLSRTVLTSLTTAIVVVVLLVAGGGGSIFDFSLILMLGIVVGTYSSIYVASAAVSWLAERGDGKLIADPIVSPSELEGAELTEETTKG